MILLQHDLEFIGLLQVSQGLRDLEDVDSGNKYESILI